MDRQEPEIFGLAADHFYSFSYRMLVGKVLLEDLLYFGVYLFSAQYVFIYDFDSDAFYHSEDIDRKNTLQKRFVLYLGNYSFGIFLIHIFFMYLCTEYLLPLLQITPSMLTFYPLLFVLMLVLSLGSMEILARLPFHELLIGKVERRLLLRRKSGRTNSL